MEHRINTDSASNQLWLCARRARERERERERGGGAGERGAGFETSIWLQCFYWRNCSKDGYIDVDGTIPLRGR